ncbi:MAG TPA: hypothetical protein VMR46_02310 [Candidatus Paceibacterota bacterium]|nr:hypothetical protein [Candidatus Paceibacterota bacterium]
MPNVFDRKTTVGGGAESAIVRARARLMQNQLEREATVRGFLQEAEARGDNAAAADFRRILAELVRDRENS